MTVEANHVGRDHIEFRAEIGQGLECLDAPDFALHSEELNHFREAGLLVQIQSENVVAEILVDVEEIAGAAADIEDALAPAQVETQIPHPPQIDFHPEFQVEIFGPGIARVSHGMPLIDLPELLGIDGLRDAGGIESKRRAAEKHLFHVTPGADVGIAREHFFEFVGKSHGRSGAEAAS